MGSDVDTIQSNRATCGAMWREEKWAWELAFGHKRYCVECCISWYWSFKCGEHDEYKQCEPWVERKALAARTRLWGVVVLCNLLLKKLQVSDLGGNTWVFVELIGFMT